MRLYHGTVEDNLALILRQGLVPPRPDFFVYVTPDLHTAWGWAITRADNRKWRYIPTGDPVVIELDGDFPIKEWGYDNYSCPVPIGPEHIVKIHREIPLDYSKKDAATSKVVLPPSAARAAATRLRQIVAELYRIGH